MGIEQMDALLDALVDEVQLILNTLNLVWDRMDQPFEKHCGQTKS